MPEVTPSETAPTYKIVVKTRCIIVIDQSGNQHPIVVTGQQASEMLEFISQIKFTK